MMNQSEATVLIVDDAPDNLRLLSAILKPHYRVKVASGVDKALAIIDQQLPDLLLLDVMLPGIDGYQLQQKLAGDSATASMPVVFITGCKWVASQSAESKLQGCEYLTKPVYPEQLLATVAKQLANSTDSGESDESTK